MSLLASILVLALTRAEIIDRMKAPVITQCDGLVQVYGDCPEDMRREYQMPIASFAAETAKSLAGGLGIKLQRREHADILIHVGDVRTNLTTVVAKASTNGTRVVSRIYVPSPGYADLFRLRLEIVKAFSRSVRGEELDDDGAVALYRKADPRLRVADERDRMELWLAGKLPSRTPEEDEENLKRLRKVIEPGVASRTDVRLFASRLFLYPAVFEAPFCGRFGCLSFRDAVKYAKADPRIRLVAYAKSGPLVAFGGGRSESLAAASRLYFVFLVELAKGGKSESELLDLLDAADVKLNVAWEEAQR